MALQGFNTVFPALCSTALSVMAHNVPQWATFGASGARALGLGEINRGVGEAAQMTHWTEPVLMLILGVALFVAAQGIRQWVRKKVKLR